MKKTKNNLIKKVLLKSTMFLIVPILLILLSGVATGVVASILIGSGLVSLIGSIISLPYIFNYNISKDAIKEVSKSVNVIKETNSEELLNDNIKICEIEKPLCTNLLEYFNEIDKVEEYKPYTKKLTR